MREPEEDTRPDESWLPRVAIAVPAVLVVVLGVFPGLIVGLLDEAAVLRW
jgi:formate hydrogenlyase subunit 3/multisubunit Na+/H+ antiporter MnhD subunit